MALPNLPARTAQEDLADQAKELRKQLEDAGKAMKDITGDNLQAMLDALAKVAQAADKAGPALKGLFNLDPSGARALQSQFQSVIDKAAEMAGAAKEKAQEAADAAKKAATQQTVKSIGLGAKAATGGLSGADVGGVIGGAIDPAGGEAVGAALGAAFDQVTAAIKQSTDALGDFIESEVKAANPGLWERYQRAAENLGAVFGQAFSPIIELVTEFTDELNGAMTEFAPIVGDLVRSLVDDFKPILNEIIKTVLVLADAFQEIWASVGPTLKSFFRELAAEIVAVVRTVEKLLMVLGALSRQEAAGKKPDVAAAVKDADAKEKRMDQRAKDAAGNKTLAAQPASFGGIEDIGREAAQKAASMGAGQGPKDPADSLDDMSKRIEQIEAGLGKFIVDVGEAFKNVQAIKDKIVNASSLPGRTLAAAESVGTGKLNPFVAGVGLAAAVENLFS